MHNSSYSKLKNPVSMRQFFSYLQDIFHNTVDSHYNKQQTSYKEIFSVPMSKIYFYYLGFENLISESFNKTK